MSYGAYWCRWEHLVKSAGEWCLTSAPVEGNLLSVNPSRPQTGLLNTADAAAFLGVHPKTLKRWVRAGKLAASTPGREYRFTREELQAFVADSVHEPESAAS